MATGGDLVVRTLQVLGVTHAFGIPGVHNLAIYDAMLDSSVTPVVNRNESGASFMAYGYARATGRPGVCTVITGPGVTNAATGVGQAFSDSVPIVVIATENPLEDLGRGRGLLHELPDQMAFMRTLTKYAVRVTARDQIPSAVKTACEMAMTGRPRPTYVEIPIDILDHEGPDIAAGGPVVPATLVPDDRALDEAAAVIRAARRPLILAGGGAAGAAAEVQALAERLRAPVITSVHGKGVVPANHPLSLGSRLSGPAVAEFVAGCDLIIAVGTELAPGDWRDWRFEAPVVHIDVDPANFGRNAPCRVGVTGDAAAALRVLLPRIGGAGAGQDPAPEVAVVRERAHRESERYPFFAPYIEAIREVVAPSGIFVGDMTQMVYTATATYPALAPRTFLFPAGFGTLGFALPVAIGAKVADPRRDVVAVLGDGGMLFNIQELVTACDEKVGLAVIVVNNGGYGEIKRAQKQRFGDRYVGADLHTPDFVALARGVGAEGVRVEEPRELGAAVRAALGRNRPTVIELPAPMILDVAR